MVGHAGTVVLYVLHILKWPWPDPSQGQRHWPSEVPKNALFYVYLLHYFGVVLTNDGWLRQYETYNCSELDFWISQPVGSHVTSRFAKCWNHENPRHFISAHTEARSLWLWLQVGHNKPCDDHQPLAGLFLFKVTTTLTSSICNCDTTAVINMQRDIITLFFCKSYSKLHANIDKMHLTRIKYVLELTIHTNCNLSFIISAISINFCSACINSTVLQWHIPNYQASSFFQHILGTISCQNI